MTDLLDIAIIGAACRLPGGCDSLPLLWDALSAGRDCVGDLPPDRWALDKYYHPDKRVPGRMYARKAGTVKSILDFDPAVFGISNAEVPYIDPQQRLALELAWEALEDAGIPPSRVADSRAAVFMGASSMDYAVRFARDMNVANPRSMQGNSLSIVANRISYFLNLHGPSMTIDTACSSSLFALHQACRLLAGDDSIAAAFAGGVNILLAPDTFVGFSKAEMLSPDGKCMAFDAAANGYVRSEGGGMVLLKRLADALRDGDRIHAVVRFSAVNSDGRTSGIALPGLAAQKELLRGIYHGAGLDPARLAYIEAHGTGTRAGDPVEAEAIGTAIAQARKNPLPIGSVKTNLGHLEPASGMAGLLKSILVLKHGIIPRSLHFTNPNPDIDFAGLNIRVAERDVPVEAELLRHAYVGVNSFGFGGSNAHVVLEAPPRSAVSAASVEAKPASAPLVLSAASPEALRLQAGVYADFLDAPGAPPAADVARAVAGQREALAHRIAAFADDRKKATAALRAFCDGTLEEGQDKMRAAFGESVFHGARNAGDGRPRTAFVFAGNGSQWAGMGRALFDACPVFAEAVERVDSLFKGLGADSLLDEMRRPAERSRLADTRIAQPLLFAVQVGLAELLRSRGIAPDLVFGHSVGEAAAAWCAGILSLEDAVRFVHHRGVRQAASRGKGGMSAVNISADEAERIAETSRGKIEVAGYNSLMSVTLTGSVAALEKIEAGLADRGIFNARLALEYPFHSRWMDPFAKALLGDLRDIRPRAGAIPFVSTVTGEVLEGARVDAEYLWQNVRQPVLFRQATETALNLGARLFMEIGPHPALAYYLNDAISRRGAGAAALQTMSRGGDTAEAFELSCLRAWSRGWPLAQEKPRQRVELPLYSWNRQPVRLPRSEECLEDVSAPPAHPLLGWKVRDLPVWENLIDTDLFPALADHAVMEQPLFPATAFVEMAAAAARAEFPNETVVELHAVQFAQAMPLPKGAHRKTRVAHSPDSGELTMSSRSPGSDEAWTRHMRCRIRRGGEAATARLEWIERPGAFGAEIPASRLYRLPPRFGFDFGPAFASVEAAWRNGDRALLRLRDKTGRAAEAWRDTLLCPPLLDSALHAGYLFLHENPETRGVPFLPIGLDRVIVHRRGMPAWSLFSLRRARGRIAGSDVDVYDENGLPLARLEMLRWKTRAGGIPGANIGPMLVERLRPPPGQPDRIALPENDALRLAAESAMRSEGDAASEEFAKDVDAAVSAAVRDAGHSAGSEFSEIWNRLLEQYPDRVEELGALLDAAEQRHPADRHVADWYGETALRSCRASAALREILRKIIRGNAADRLLRLMEVDAAGGLLEGMRPLLAGANCLYGMTTRDEAALDSLKMRWRSFEPAEFLGVTDEAMQSAEAASAQERADVALLAFPLRGLEKTENILAFCRERLSDGGLCLLVQRRPSRVLDFVYGRSPDWWFRSPSSEQSATPLFEPDEWRAMFRAAGFASVEAVWEDAEGFVLAARRPARAGEKATDHLPNARALESHALAAHRRSRHGKALAAPGQADWIILADAEPSPIAEALLEVLSGEFKARNLANSTVRVHSGAEKPAGKALRGDSHRAWMEFWSGRSPGKAMRCISLLGFDDDKSIDADVFETRTLRQTTFLAMAIRGWLEAGEPPLSMILLSAGGQEAPEATPVPSQGAIWGLGRVLANETPQISPRLIDMHIGPGDDKKRAIASLVPVLRRELFEPGNSPEIVLAGNHEYYPHIEPASADMPAVSPIADGFPALRLRPSRSGALERAEWVDISLPRPGPGEVLVRPAAAGLNFRDIMCAMGALPDEAFTAGVFGPFLGNEFSGVVEAVGENVTAFAAGDEVAGMAAASLSSLVLAPARFLLHKPERFSHEACATLPVALSTAWYALTAAGKLRQGERLLVHAAAGGVGLMAIQIARHLGVDVFATAGSESKRAFLRRLGVKHVYSSRSLAFADEIRAATNGEGVDAVLNSLAGDAMLRSLEIVRPYGRFLELGKRDLYGDSAIGLRALRQNVSYHALDLDAYAADSPETMASLLRSAWDLVENGTLHPLPHRVFSPDAITGALRDMQRARHIGKLVCSMRVPPEQAGDARPRAWNGISENASYIVTGGTSGFGLAATLWLADQGARHLALVSRSGEIRPADRPAIDELRTSGVEVRIVAADVADAGALFGRLDAALAGMPPLKGIVHAAGVLDDAALAAMTPEQVERTLRAKTLGGWNMHRYSEGRDLDLFILFSSVAAFLGNRGQANYAAANAALDTLAAYRRATGRPALSLAWGPIGDTGMLTRNPAAREVLKKQLGLFFMNSGMALGMMEKALSLPDSLVAVLSADARRLLRLPSAGSPRYGHFASLIGDDIEDGDILLREVRSKPADEAIALLERLVKNQVAAALRLAANAVNSTVPLDSLGVDSLMAVEIGLALEAALGENAPHIMIAPGKTIRNLAEDVYAGLSMETS